VEAAFIAAIVAAPEAIEPWTAYRDWLIERGDRRGEWIRLSLEGDEETSRRPIVREELLLSPRLNEQAHLLNIGWWRGFIRSAVLIGAMDDPPTFETIDALFADPHAALLSTLKIDHPISRTVPLWQALLATERPTITKLQTANLGSGGSEIGKRLPGLESLVLGGMYLFARWLKPTESSIARTDQIEHHQLREFSTGPGSCPALIAGDFILPQLRLLNWDVLEGYDGADPEADPPGYELFTSSSSMLHRPPAGLVELGLLGSIVRKRDAQRITAGCELRMLESCPALAQLRRLRLRPFIPADVTLKDLLTRAASFRHLEAIEVQGHAKLSREDVDALKVDLQRALPNTYLDVRWDALVMRDPDVPSSLLGPVDSASRNSDGRIDAIGRWISGERK